MKRLLLLTVLILALTGCGADTVAPRESETTPESSVEATEESSESTEAASTSQPLQTRLFEEQIFPGADGDIHYSYYLPDRPLN